MLPLELIHRLPLSQGEKLRADACLVSDSSQLEAQNRHIQHNATRFTVVLILILMNLYLNNLM